MSQSQQTTQDSTGDDTPTPPKALRGGHLTTWLLRRKVWRPANRENDWCVFVIVGREGSGKSHTCLSMLEKVDPTFDADRVHFGPESFLECIHEMPKDERQGRAVMLDESGVGMGVRSWYDREQMKLNKLMQTARDDNMIVGVTLPRLSELDSQFRGRLHGFVEMRDLHEGEFAVFSWKNVKPTRDENNKLYKQYPRVRRAGREQRVTRLAIDPPSAEVAEPYEDKKARFKDELYEETLEALGDGDEEDDQESPKQIAENLVDSGDLSGIVSIHGGHNKPQIDTDLIRMEYELSGPKAQQVKKALRPNFSREELEEFV